MPSGHSALTGVLGICEFPWQGKALGQIHLRGGQDWEKTQVSTVKYLIS